MREPDLHQIGQIFNHERLVVDRHEPGRTCFHSHFGASSRLMNGPWIAHRDWVKAASLRPLGASLQASLARTAIHNYNQNFGVGKLQLSTSSSGVPFGGSLLKLQLRGSSLRCTYGFCLGKEAQAMPCDWLIFHLNSRWAHNIVAPKPANLLRPDGIKTLIALGARILILTATVVEARQIADALPEKLQVTGHPRFSAYLPNHQSPSQTQLVLWPYDSMHSNSLLRQHFDALIMVDPLEQEIQRCERWAESQAVSDITPIGNPDHMDPSTFLKFWKSCGQPAILLRGDARWLRPTEVWLRERGIEVHSQSQGAQLGLLY